jgi:hypothetical protein
VSARALIADLTRRGVELAVNADRLRWRAPKGTVGSQELAALRHHKAEIIELLSRQQGGGRSGPKGDTPASWRAWFHERMEQHRCLGRDDGLARTLSWGGVENIWHQRHGAKLDPSKCAGCDRLLSGRARLTLGDDASVHWDEGAGLGCLGSYGRRWRAEATAGLVALGLEPPDELST